jgi:hypothetical protein
MFGDANILGQSTARWAAWLLCLLSMVFSSAVIGRSLHFGHWHKICFAKRIFAMFQKYCSDLAHRESAVRMSSHCATAQSRIAAFILADRARVGARLRPIRGNDHGIAPLG